MKILQKCTFWLALSLTGILVAQQNNKTVIDLWPESVPGQIEAKQQSVVSENTSGNVMRLAKVTQPTLTVFKPEKPNQSGAAVIVCPGGGYGILAIDKEGCEIAEWLNQLGYTAFVLQYRVPKNRAGAIQDVQRAIKVVRSKAELYKLNTNKIGVLGFSAGGHLAARASINYNIETYSKIDEVDDFSPRPNFTMLIYPAYLDSGEDRTISPEFQFNDFTPPCFVFGTVDDPYGNSALEITKALRDKKVPVELHMLAKGGHGYGLRKGNNAAKTWPKLAESWLDKLVNSMQIAKYERKLNFPKTEVKAANLPEKKDVWVFFLAGQSNMAGRGFIEPNDTIPNSRILTINKSNTIVLAKEPLHFYEPKMAGLDCGVSFARTLLKEIPEHVSILLIPTAVGGSSISKWINDEEHRTVKLFTNFKANMDFAKTYGTVKGVLWHQGESDANKNGIKNYDKNLNRLFKSFRKAAGNKNLPIILGELGGFRTDSETWKAMNMIIHNYAEKHKYTEAVSTEDLTDRGDNLHFNSISERKLGERFAKTFLNMQPK
ncbi:sialate O-acetylesterase [Neotamlana sedimentorum]|uniref:sialate O-acetylesterase n=1 Tax=Neotamlana sedimentorum TaxID=1435349 RepID=UPI000A87C729|nr:sialate O-acetylesterase [Tamlana sedimentorum]